MRTISTVITTLFACVLVPAAAADPPPACEGVPPLGTDQEIAATPRADAELELLTLEMSGGLTADQGIYDRVTADVGMVFALMPDIADIPFLTSRHDGRGILFQADDTAWDAIQRGAYTAWDCLNDHYVLDSMRLFSTIKGGVLFLKGIYETELLVPLYEQLPGLTDAGTNYFGGDGPKLCGIVDSSGAHHYFFDDRRGDCPAGCGTFDIRYLTTSAAGALPQLRGQWRLEDGEPLPPWYDLHEHCLDEPGRLPAAIAVDPAAPAANDLVRLTVSGTDGSSCGPFFNRVDVDAETQTIRVRTDSNASCGACPPSVVPYSFDVDLGSLPAGEYQVQVVDRDGCRGNERDLLGLTQLTVRQAVEEPAGTCAGGNRTAATLLVPYFEVDLADPAGPTTVFSVGNAAAEPVLAHVVLWTDGGLPSLDFDLYLGPNDLHTIDLRGVFESGRLPLTGAGGGEGPPGCASPVALPDLDAAALAVLKAKHTGRPSPADGLCYGSPTDLAVGYVTVDAMNGCSPTIRHPGDAGYFETGGTGLASNRNVLWGDVFYLSSIDGSAQGVEAVAIRAGAVEHFADPPASSFYGSYVGRDGRDNRLPLGQRYRSRFLNGGAANMTSEVIVWTEGLGVEALPRDCEPDSGLPQLELVVVASFRDQKGGFAGAATQHLDGRTVKLTIGKDPMAPTTSFGQVDIGTGINCLTCLRPFFPSLQTWAIGVSRAAGRFSTAQHATLLDDGCP